MSIRSRRYNIRVKSECFENAIDLGILVPFPSLGFENLERVAIVGGFVFGRHLADQVRCVSAPNWRWRGEVAAPRVNVGGRCWRGPNVSRGEPLQLQGSPRDSIIDKITDKRLPH